LTKQIASMTASLLAGPLIAAAGPVFGLWLPKASPDGIRGRFTSWPRAVTVGESSAKHGHERDDAVSTNN
jgi:hypothetical protein